MALERLSYFLTRFSSEVRFGSRALAPFVPASRIATAVWPYRYPQQFSVLGFALAMKANSADLSLWLPHGFRDAILPGLPLVAWIGVVLGVPGLLLRLWAVLTLRERYTRTLLVQREHTVERNGPYHWVRYTHSGYLGSLLLP